MCISSLGSVVRAHPNQEPVSVPHLLKLKPLNQLNLDEVMALDLEEALLDAGEDGVEEVECANVLKKRRRKMRGHKHKKRLKERRHKSDK